ncbi:cache domain-containing protein [Paenibacillus sp. P36]|uniref:cache domain-containing protein n=1 Tax=Paenibacillus sp. P36 TaxID=3342538 RepID=UPI0038B3B01E
MKRTKINKTNGQQHFFQRLFLFNLMLVVLITFIPVAVYYHYFSKALNEQLENLNLKTALQFQNSIDNEFLKDRMKALQTYFLDSTVDDTFTKPMTDSIRYDTIAILRIANQLDTLRNNLQNVSSIDVYYKNDNVLFYNSRFCFMNEMTCNIGARRDWLDEFQTTESQVRWIPPRQVDDSDTGPIITYVRSIPYFAPPEKRKAIIAFNMEQNTLKKSLQALKKPEDGLILIVDEQGNIIAHNQIKDQVAELQDERKPWIAQVLGDRTEGMLNTDIAGNSTMVSYTKSQYNDWHYVSLVNRDLFYKRSIDLKNWLISVVLLILSVSVLISYILTKRAHKPIRHVIGDYSTKLVDLHLKAEINKPVIRHNYIMSLLHDETFTQAYLLTNDLVKADMPWKQFCSFVIQTPKLEQFENEYAASFHLIALLEENTDPDFQIWAIKDYSKQIQGILFWDDHASLSGILERIIDHTVTIYDDHYVLAYGKTYTIGETPISVSYQEALVALKYAYLLPKVSKLSYAQLDVAARRRSGSSERVLGEIEGCIRL